ncbi:MAG: response regulator, partial [Desulfovibrio sp.]|nr:response regulator [Desulfovibrio sp.]
MRILIVDDEKEFLDLMEKRLSRRGISVVTANDGQSGLDIVQGDDAADPSKVVVMDVRMPG